MTFGVGTDKCVHYSVYPKLVIRICYIENSLLEFVIMQVALIMFNSRHAQ